MRPIREYLKLVSASGFIPASCYQAVNKTSGALRKRALRDQHTVRRLRLGSTAGHAWTSRPLALAHESTACGRMNSRPRTTPPSEPVANERARRGPQEEHAGDVVDCVHRLALFAQIHARARLPAILVDLKQYVAVSIGRASQHEN